MLLEGLNDEIVPVKLMALKRLKVNVSFNVFVTNSEEFPILRATFGLQIIWKERRLRRMSCH